MADTVSTGLLDIPVREFGRRLASSTPVPGGGSAAALAAALGAGLVSMVGHLTVGREQFQDVEREMQLLLTASEALGNRAARLVEADAAAYGSYAAALQLPRGTAEERRARTAAMQAALREATVVPLQLAEACADLLGLARRAAALGNPTVIADAAAGALLTDAALHSAELNVVTNLKHVRDEAFAAAARERLAAALARAAGAADAAAAEVRRRLEV